jgi:pimeloyl-ACP methyl ester carboxylesterase
MFTETSIVVSAEPKVELFTLRTDGPADRVLLVIHGGPDWDHTYLRDPLLRLAGRHRVLLPDLRGCGRSTRHLPDSEYTWDAVVHDLLALLDAEDVATADLLGFSTGGLIAQRLVLAAPNRFRRLVVASSSVLPVPDDAFADWPEYEARHREGRAAGLDPTGLTGARLNRADAVNSAPANLWRRELLPDYLRLLDEIQWSGEWSRVWEAGLLGSPRPDRGPERLAALGLPTLLLQGRYDMTFPAALAEDTAARDPAARAVVLDEAGHMAHLDQPEAWLAALTEFLS